jgi:hypothetical protein
MRKGQLVIVQEILPFPSPPIHSRILAKQVSKTTKPNRSEKQTPRPLPGITSNSFLRKQWENRKKEEKKQINSAPSSSINPPIPSLSKDALFVQMHLH